MEDEQVSATRLREGPKTTTRTTRERERERERDGNSLLFAHDGAACILKMVLFFNSSNQRDLLRFLLENSRFRIEIFKPEFFKPSSPSASAMPFADDAPSKTARIAVASNLPLSRLLFPSPKHNITMVSLLYEATALIAKWGQ